MLDRREPPADDERTSLHRPVHRRARGRHVDEDDLPHHDIVREWSDDDRLPHIPRAVAQRRNPIYANPPGVVLELRGYLTPGKTRREPAAVGPRRDRLDARGADQA